METKSDEDVRDPYNHKRRYEEWLKNKEIEGVNTNNKKIILKFLDDMAIGMNVNNRKGARSPIRLNTLRSRLKFIAMHLQERGIKGITRVKAEQLHAFFSDMRTGVIKTRSGTPYKSAGDYVRAFKTFWHWYQKVMRQKKKIIDDITLDLDATREKGKFVYLTREDFEKVLNGASYDLKVALALAFDSGVRVTELVNVKVSDFSEDFKALSIREETTKTFGRKIKLMLCSEQIREYVNKFKLEPNDFLVRLSPTMMNSELRTIGKKVLGPEQIKHKNLALYDFRHSSACYWLPIYKSESALKYRFGWKKSEMIHYYTEYLGMKDTITQDDMYIDITKTEIEKQLVEEKRAREKLEKRFKKLEEKREKKDKGLAEAFGLDKELVSKLLKTIIRNRGQEWLKDFLEVP